jgi:putative acetyltransferase
MRPSF